MCQVIQLPEDKAEELDTVTLCTVYDCYPHLQKRKLRAQRREATFPRSPPGSQASSRGEAKDSALLSSRDAALLEPLSGLKGVQPPLPFGHYIS